MSSERILKKVSAHGLYGRKWLVDFNARKTQLFSFYRSNNTAAIDVKMDGSVLEEKNLLRCWGLFSLLNWIEKLEIGALIRSMKFLSPRVALFLSINVPDGHALNTVVMSGLVLLTVTC